MKKIIIPFLILLIFGFAEYKKPAYQIFDKEGNKADYQQLLNKAMESDIIFFGELHNNPIIHWLQLELTQAIYEKKGNDLIMGAEMFETDNQLILNEYMDDFIAERNFEKEARLWNNYTTDYKPIVEFAKDKDLEFIATNIPRRYAAIVSKNGFDSLEILPSQSKKYMAPLPIKYDPEHGAYKRMSDMMGGGAMGGMHGNPNLPKAQAIKDATMAHFILKYFKKNKIFLHFNGAFHSDYHEGIVWYVKEKKKNLKILVISAAAQQDISILDDEHKNKGDFIIVTPSNMTTTY